jgi:hypothetical protein
VQEVEMQELKEGQLSSAKPEQDSLSVTSLERNENGTQERK